MSTSVAKVTDIKSVRSKSDKIEEHMVPLYHLELVREKDLKYKSVAKVEAAAEIFHQMLDSSPIEKMATIHMNSSGEMIGAEIIAIGNMESVGTAMSNLYRGAIMNNASAIYMAHNHVSGDVTPSPQDYGFTKAAIEASELLGIRFHDHLIIGPGNYYSIYDHRDGYAAAMQKLMPRPNYGYGNLEKMFGNLFDKKANTGR